RPHRCSSSQPPCATATSTLSLHDALPILSPRLRGGGRPGRRRREGGRPREGHRRGGVEGGQRGEAALLARRAARLPGPGGGRGRSEEHTSELQSRENLVCRLLLEKKKKTL